jgi:molybdate transport system ATP-binding protein
MSEGLGADFEKRYRNGATIRAKFFQPGGGFVSTVLFGPSGSGKTTILRCIAGLEQPDSGSIQFGPHVWFDAERGISQRPMQRGIGFLFQDYALFPHLTVSGNIEYGLSRLTRSERTRRKSSLLGLLELTGLERRYPHQLSSGQQQRVALARAVAPRPKLLLLDEPLSALDAPTRQSLRRELRGILTELNTPTLLVTHDPLEAIALADHAIVLSGGAIHQQGPVNEVFSRPADPTVARIVGIETIEPGVVLEVIDGLARVRAGAVELLAVAPDIKAGNVFLCIRGEEVTIERGDPPSQSSARNRLPATVVSLHSEGAMIRVTLECGFTVTALVTRPAIAQLGLAPGEKVTALIKAPAIHLVAR